MNGRFELFTALINKISRNIKKIKKQEMAEYGLKGPQISCLYYLYVLDGLTATELCERCEEDKATISRSLCFLEKNGYVVCDSKSAKRYKCALFLTERGKAAGKRIAEKVDNILEEISAQLTEKERTALYSSLTAISDGLDVIGKRLGTQNI